MSITSEVELSGMKAISDAVGITLKKMREYAEVGMNAKELDEYGGEILRSFGAKSAPKLTYGFPGWTCISTNHEIAHGIPYANKLLKEGDLINIDVSAELNDFWADNGGSFVLGADVAKHEKLVNTSKEILRKAIYAIKGGVRISHIGKLIQQEAKKNGYKVIKNLAGHGVGRSLHEEPSNILCYYDALNRERFRKNSVVAVETFISTKGTFAHTEKDGWTLTAKDNRTFVAQHEHTILITDGEPIILTEKNGIWD